MNMISDNSTVTGCALHVAALPPKMAASDNHRLLLELMQLQEYKK